MGWIRAPSGVELASEAGLPRRHGMRSITPDSGPHIRAARALSNLGSVRVSPAARRAPAPTRECAHGSAGGGETGPDEMGWGWGWDPTCPGKIPRTAPLRAAS